jgi:hypothetical protein
VTEERDAKVCPVCEGEPGKADKCDNCENGIVYEAAARPTEDNPLDLTSRPR